MFVVVAHGSSMSMLSSSSSQFEAKDPLSVGAAEWVRPGRTLPISETSCSDGCGQSNGWRQQRDVTSKQLDEAFRCVVDNWLCRVRTSPPSASNATTGANTRPL